MPGSQAFVAATTVGVHCPTYNQARNISNRQPNRQPATCQIVTYQTEKCRGRNKQRNEKVAHSATRARHCVSTVPTTPSSHTVCAKSMEFAVIAWYTCNDRERLPNGMETVRGRERLASKWDGNGNGERQRTFGTSDTFELCPAHTIGRGCVAPL